MKSKIVMITGAAGFIGSHCVEHFLKETDWQIVGVDSLKHKGKIERVNHLLCDRYSFIKADIATHQGSEMLRLYYPDVIVNFASESHVDRSIDDPVPFVANNFNLMVNMLEYARLIKPELFIQISTDEVYGPAAVGQEHPEWDVILPSNPYSASKAAQEALSIAWWRTYGVPIVITNTMNNYGERQDTEKYIPMIIKRILNNEVVTVHGRSDEIGSRFYLHARNHADALRYIIENLPASKFGEADRPDRYNVVGNEEATNLEIAQKIADIMGQELQYELQDFHTTRPGHDPRYGLDGQKLSELGWELPVPFEDSLIQTVEWSLEHPEWLI